MPALSVPFYDRAGDRYAPGGTRAFYVLLGAALLAMVGYEALNRQWDVQAGLLCGRRLIVVPRAPAWTLAVEWALAAACALALIAGRGRAAAARLGAAVLLWGAGQRYMNQKALLALLFLYIALDPPDPDREGFAEEGHPNLTLVVWQLSIVYAFSALHKARSGFLAGGMFTDALAMVAETGAWTPVPAGSAAAALAGAPAAVLSWATVLAEAALAWLIWARPRAALWGVLALHAGFVLLLPGVTAFSLAMAACAVLAAARRT